jgi:hypothetical protein
MLVSEIVVYAVATVWRGAWFAFGRVAVPMFLVIVVAGLLGLAMREGTYRDLRVAIIGASCVLFVAAAIGIGAVARVAALAVGKWPIIAVLVATVLGVRLSVGTGVAVTVAILATLAGVRLQRLEVRRGRAMRVFERMTTWGGTSFHGANLECADYSGARLCNTDFFGARIDGTRWPDTIQTGFCRFDANSAPLRKAQSHGT